MWKRKSCRVIDRRWGGISRVLHQHSRRHLIWRARADRSRPVLLDSCEGVCFDFDGGAIAERAASRAELGVELFVINGIWFGEEYERMTRTLRNCTSNSVLRFPKGLNSVVDRATFRTVAVSGEKLQFAIWVESDGSKPQVLYSLDKHPDWALQAEGHVPVERSLQPARPQPRVTRRAGPNHGKNNDALIRSAPTALVKWDSNRGTHYAC
ncbi:hypothetical protein MY4038_005455 [Beauveria bassiana]